MIDISVRQIAEAITAVDIRLAVEKHRVRVRADGYTADLNTFDGQDFPIPPTRAIGENLSIDIPAAALRYLLNATAFAIDTDQPHTSYAIVQRRASDTHVMASNGHIIVGATVPAWEGVGPTRFWLTAKTVRALQAFVADDDPIRAQLGETHCFFDVAHRTLVVRPADAPLMEKPVLAMVKILARPFTDVVSVSTDALAAAVGRLMETMLSPEHSLLVRIAEDALVLTYEGTDEASSRERLDVTYDGPEVTFRVRGAYLRDVAEHCGHETLTLGVSAEQNDPIRITAANDIGSRAFACVIAQASK